MTPDLSRENSKRDGLILGIETSCDETAAAVVARDGSVLSNVVASQVDIHSRFGGIVPEIASRKHVEAIVPVVEEALLQAGCTLEALSAIAVTQGPGLVGALVVGLSFSKALAIPLDLPLCGVNHIQAHLMSLFLKDVSREGKAGPVPDFPFIGLVVSGGHTSLYHVRGPLDMELLGGTRDDAAGEAFDKVAKLLGLSYPGGPVISALAQKGSPEAFSFPRARLPDTPFDFSFSGLKTAVLQKVTELSNSKEGIPVEDICASFQAAVVDVLVEKTLMAASKHGLRTIVASGGVSANPMLRQQMKRKAREAGMACFFPRPEFCTDNGAMVAYAGWFMLEAGLTLEPDADVYSRLAV
jgi:N6-L-threonylcarbamoyladenine synthase